MTSLEPGTWSPNEILWHLRAQSDVYGEHIARILNEDAPRWRHVSPRARMKKARYDHLSSAESFAPFTRQRGGVIALLRSLAPPEWERFAIVRTPERESRLTLSQRVWVMANHEEAHCLQVGAGGRHASRKPRSRTIVTALTTDYGSGLGWPQGSVGAQNRERRRPPGRSRWLCVAADRG